MNVSWDGDAGRFTASGTHAGHTIVINAPRRPGESRGSTGFSATELLLAGAGSCAAWDVVEILRKRRQGVRSLEVTVEGDQQPDPPWAYTRVALHFRVACDDIRMSVLQRVVRLSCVRYCSVVTTIRGVAAIEATVELIAADGTSSGRHAVDLSVVPAAATAVDLPAIGVAEPRLDED